MRYFLFAAKQWFLNSLRKIFAAVAGGVDCAVCGKHTSDLLVCASCKEKYFATSFFDREKRCRVCGRLLVSERGVCMQCRGERLLLHTDSVFPIFSYRLWNGVLLGLWKQHGERALSPFFAERAAAVLKHLPPFDALVPVPPRPGKIRKNGWDQIEELCHFLELGHRFRVCRLLERGTKCEQKKLDRAGRLSQLGKAYFIKEGKKRKKALKRFRGNVPRSVCLIDDMMTTGTTLETCAAALKAAGVEKVHALTLFAGD